MDIKHIAQLVTEDPDIIKQFQLFCDMDGVLVDFNTGMVERFNQIFQSVFRSLQKDPNNKYIDTDIVDSMKELGWTLESNEAPIVTQNDMELISSKAWKRDTTAKKLAKTNKLKYKLVSNDAEFWASLPLMPGAIELWKYIEQYNPIILTGPMGGGSVRGKNVWVDKNIGSHIQVIATQHKYKMAKYEGKTGILIDDLDKYLIPFKQNGGISIKHIDTSTSIKHLKTLGL